MYLFFCFISFFALYSNVQWRKVLKQTISCQSMACQCDELYLGLNQGFLNSIQHRFLSLFQAHHWKFLCLLMVLHLFSESLTILLCFFTRSCNGPVLFFFNLLICSWRKLLSWQSWWILPSSFALITSLSELYFGIGRFILLVRTKKVISMTYDSSTSSWKGWRWVRLDLILTMRVTYNSNLNPLTKSTSSSRSTEFRYPPMEHLPNDLEDHPIQHKIRHKLYNETEHLLWIWWKVNGNWYNNMITISQWRESHCRTNTKERNKYKRAGLWESQSGMCEYES